MNYYWIICESSKIANTCSKKKSTGSACDAYDVMQFGLDYVHAEGGVGS